MTASYHRLPSGTIIVDDPLDLAIARVRRRAHHLAIGHIAYCAGCGESITEEYEQQYQAVEDDEGLWHSWCRERETEARDRDAELFGRRMPHEYYD